MSLGFPIVNEGIVELFKRFDEYIKTGEYWSGKIKINGSDVGRKELIGKNPVIILSPEEQRITKGSPGNRRNYFDKLYSTTSGSYFENLSGYFKNSTTSSFIWGTVVYS